MRKYLLYERESDIKRTGTWRCIAADKDDEATLEEVLVHSIAVDRVGFN